MARAAATAPMKQAAAARMRRTAALLDADHPETIAGDHLRDAARVLERGQLEGAKRHLDAAMEVLTPRNLIRHGITDDEGHATAKHHMHQVHRHRLAVQDIEDAHGRNDRLRAMARAARGQPEPREPFQPAEPVATANRHAKVIQLVGPHGYTHGWVYHGPQGSQGHYAAVLSHPELDRIDRQSHAAITQHLNRAKGAAASGDHTTAEMHLTDARRKATRLGESDLASAIGTLKDYHHRQAAEAIGVKPNITQGQMNRVVAREQARPRPKPRAVPGPGRQPPFALATRTTELSARTAMLERTPAPRGRPGGPGLYDVSGMGHTAYLQQIVKALIEKRGMPPGKAYAIARGAIRKWMRGGGHVHPEVMAAAGKAEAGELARQARAKASHGHAADPWEQVDILIELATETIDLFNPYHAPTGQFTTASGAGAGQGKGNRKQKRAALLKRAAGLRSQIRALEAQLHAATRSSRSRRSKSSTPAKKGAGAQSARQAKQGKAASGKAAGSTRSQASMSPATIRAKILALRGALQTTLAQLRALK